MKETKLKTIDMKNGKIVVSELDYGIEADKHINIGIYNKEAKRMVTLKVYEYTNSESIKDNIYWDLSN